MTRTILLINRDGSIRPTGYAPDHHPTFWRVMKMAPLRVLLQDASDVVPSHAAGDLVEYRLLAESKPYLIYEEVAR